jgi:hypothetical protein
MMDTLVHSPDFTWAMSKVFIWSCCEPFIGILCACLPTYAPLVRRFWRRNDYGTPYGHEKYASDKPHTGTGRPGNRGSRKPHGSMLGSATLRGDDEIELTVDISADGPRKAASRESSLAKVNGSPDRSVCESNEITVTKDFSWYSTSA